MSIWHAPLPDLAKLDALGTGSMPGHLGITFTGSGDDWLGARMPIDERTVQPWGRLHGGASVALAETVASVGAMLTIDPKTSAAVGLEINANHVRPASGGFVASTHQSMASSVGQALVWAQRSLMPWFWIAGHHSSKPRLASSSGAST